jgi:hypothetical protein
VCVPEVVHGLHCRHGFRHVEFGSLLAARRRSFNHVRM